MKTALNIPFFGLDLSNNDIEDKEIEKIIEILSHNQKLELFF